MPTLPNSSLFDKDLSLRSPFPRHVSAIGHSTASTESSEANRERTQHNARLDFSQIKRPVPLKAQPSPPISNAQPSHSIPHSLRNLLHFTAPSTAKWTTVDNQLNRIYNASPMPKIIDQTYSSLGGSARPHLHAHAAHSSPLPREAETVVHPSIEDHLSLRLGVSDHRSDLTSDIKKQDKPDFQTDSSSQFDIGIEERHPLPLEESGSPRENIALDGDSHSTSGEDHAREGHVSLSNNEATSRKRKSKASRTHGRSKYRKTNPIAQARIQSAIIEARPANGFTLPSSPQSRNQAKPSFDLEQDRETTVTGDSMDGEPEAGHRPKLRRPRMSVGQWFKGSLWDPPNSTKRERRPPSQWWMPSSTVPKIRKKKPKETQKDEVDTIEPATSGGAVSEAPVCVEMKGDTAAGIVSKEIYDFSDG